jgi:hypothetical protein
MVGRLLSRRSRRTKCCSARHEEEAEEADWLGNQYTHPEQMHKTPAFSGHRPPPLCVCLSISSQRNSQILPHSDFLLSQIFRKLRQSSFMSRFLNSLYAT